VVDPAACFVVVASEAEAAKNKAAIAKILIMAKNENASKIVCNLSTNWSPEHVHKH